MQGDVEPTSPYCDEIRAAMSKAETGIRGRRSSEIELLLGYKNLDEVIHRDDLVIL